MSFRNLLSRISKMEAERKPDPIPYQVRFSNGEVIEMTFAEVTECIGRETWNYDENRHVIEVTGGPASQFFNCLLK